jgi:hypothetical protein
VTLQFIVLKSPNLGRGGEEGRDGLGDMGGPGILGIKDVET